ncbi:NodT family efflux transporter outer membrane factor (OMF) lipoprotein [Paraburkholderia caballeronis]|uniref:efflux transporter outer membrane subunit n=1 Tax=Paraburkholderia caballeronis TaxID=416943 RepID=UPI0010D505D4|nr:efflux transporter outer membrane subunit [Paraburkholderia caballeronis]TDV24011.1 NodT family efflux transporter outer membrane factor (OMF) lipoprotein [Paraburkholderia caballeronis]
MLAALLVSGCYRPLRLDSAQPLPPKFAEADAAQAATPVESDAQLAEWWTLYHDGTLTQLVTLALAQNHDIRLAATRLDEARATIVAARSQLFPMVGAGVEGLRYHGGETELELQQLLGVNDLTVQMWRVGVQAQWEVDVFGRNRARLAATRSLATAAAGDAQAVRLAVASAVADLYVTYRALVRQRALLAQSEAIARDFVAIAGRSYAAGVVLSTSINVAQAALAQVGARQQEIDAAITQARLGLENLCAQQPGAFGDLLAGDAGLPAALPAIGPGQPVDLMMRRPDLIAAEARLRASIAQSDVARLNYWPTFSLSALLARNGLDLAGQAIGPSTFWLFGAGAALPLIDFGARRSQIELSDARANQALQAYERTALAALYDVERALARLNRQTAQRRMRDAEVAERETALHKVTRRLAVGDAGRAEVDDARVALLESRSAQVRDQAAEVQAQVALFRAMGGGWRIDDPGSGAPAAARADR